MRGPEHEIELANDLYRQIVGRRDLEGLTIREALPEIAGQGFFELLDGVYRTGEAYTGTEALVLLDRHGDGVLEEAFVNFVYLPTRDDAGEVDGILAHAVDVTELVRSRRRAEALARELDDERARLATVLDQLPAGVVIGDVPTGRLLLANREWREFFGVPLDVVDGIEGYARFEGLREDGTPYAAHEYPLARALQAGETVVGEQIEFRRADGARRWIEINAAPIRDRDGRIGAGVAAFFDVTERRRAEALLESHQAVLRLVAEGGPLDRTLDLLVRMIEQRADDGLLASVLLLDRDGAHLRHGAAPSLPAEYNAAIDGLAIGPSAGSCGTAAHRRERVVVADIEHDPLWAEFAHLALPHGLRACWSTPILSTHGETLGTFALYAREPGDPRPEHEELVRIATRTAAVAIERTRLETERRELLERAEQRAQAAVSLEYVADGVCLVDRDGVVRLWNPAAERILGLRADEVTGRRLVDAVAGWDAVLAQAPGEAATAVPLEHGGRELWLAVTAADFADGVVYAFRDVTDEHRLEELRAEMVATVSHELRTPLAAVYGAAMTLQRSELSSDAVPALVGMIGSEAERLRTLIDEILVASRLEAGGDIELRPSRFDGRTLAADVVDAVGAESDVELELSAEPAPVAADAERARQALANLLDNALKYAGAAGPVQVRVERTAGAVRFSVADRGPGIPHAEQARIFDKFVRLDPNLLSGVGGTGLGLYIARALVERMGGRISVESAEGAGATFAFELPAA